MHATLTGFVGNKMVANGERTVFAVVAIGVIFYRTYSPFQGNEIKRSGVSYVIFPVVLNGRISVLCTSLNSPETDLKIRERIARTTSISAYMHVLDRP